MLVCVPMPESAVNSQIDLHQTASDCPNCGAQVSGNFCHECGQETVLHPPSTREFLHEFIGHYVALEGKLLQTMKLLLLKPGQLSLEYMRGRRVRYIEPLRVYLTFSLIFFAAFKFMGEERHIGGVKFDSAPVIKIDQQDRKKAPAPAAAAAKPQAGAAATPDEDEGDDSAEAAASGSEARTDAAQKGAILTSVAKDVTHGITKDLKKDLTKDLTKDLEKDDSGIVDMLKKVGSDATDDNGVKLKKAFFSSAPYAVFAMMPLFALYLKILYLGSGKRYGEHLLFALHTNGFAFLMLTLILLVPSGTPYVGKLLMLWLAFYLPIAMRRVYGGGRFMTFLRWCVLMLLHIVSMAVAISAVVVKGAAS
jgi:hypothetical protein